MHICLLSHFSALMQCDDSIRRMKELADATNESFYKAHAAKTAGNVTSAVGGGICIGVATVLIPFTAGISAIAIIPGAILGGVGGVVSAGAEIGHIVVRNEKKKAAEQQLLLEKDKLEEIQQLGEELKKQVDGLVKKYPNIKQHLIIQHVMEPVTVGKGLYRGVDGAIDVGRVVLLPLKTALGKVFLALEVVALPLDLAFMGYSAFKVHNYRQGKRISDVAKKLDEVINQLEDTKFEIEEQLNEML